MSSESGAETTEEAAARGFAEYLRKPFAAEQLAAALEKGFIALGKSRA
jgi:response regulator of citrate/malate metabolism